MPFGPRLLSDMRMEFRLWAPGAQRVELSLQGAAPELRIAMAAEPDGWFGIITDAAPVNAYYGFVINGTQHVPDPASRYQPEGVHGPSQVIDPCEFVWEDDNWCGRPWEEAVIYEMHVGTFTQEGTFKAAERKLQYLAGLGITAVELMPVAEFAGTRGWGYDGVLPFAPAHIYGRPEDLKSFVQAAHRLGLMVFMDVVYNHFGPEGNYLSIYAPQFFTQKHHTPWGAAINYDDVGSSWVRQYFIHNALYWIEEYHLDGLRLDAVHAIMDDTQPHILVKLAEAVRWWPRDSRHVHLVLENDRNEARYLARDTQGVTSRHTAQWNDDWHHAAHVIATGDNQGYYIDYADAPLAHLGRCLTSGFAYQGEPSRFRDGAPRGEPSADLPLSAFVNFLQNHDQIGNRAFGERLGAIAPREALRALTAILLLAPSPPLLFMGQEWSAPEPFLFFCDFGPDLAPKVVEGRRNEFAGFAAFQDPEQRARIPDPGDVNTWKASALNWQRAEQGEHALWLAFHRSLLALRREEIVPLLGGMPPGRAEFSILHGRGLRVTWPTARGAVLRLLANLSNAELNDAPVQPGRLIYSTGQARPAGDSRLPPWTAEWSIAQEAGAPDT